ncbi:MAG: PKD domain-containing protein [Thermotogota bacterium]
MGRDSRTTNGARRRTRLGTALLVGLAALLAASPVAAAQTAPQVRQPGDPSFSSEARAALTKGLAALEAVLSAPNWGSGKALGYGGWGSREFSLYTAGALGERGYSVTIVRADNSSNARTWLLVGILLPGTVAWVPVEAAPGAGLPQTVLGRIPMNGNAFASNYLTYAGTVSLPPNVAPTARIRPPSTRPNPNQPSELLALGSADPDGYIVVYRWDFGDGTSAVFSDTRAVHTFAASGNYTLTLTVIDNGGRSNVATWTLAVGSDVTPSIDRPTAPGCGCH